MIFATKTSLYETLSEMFYRPQLILGGLEIRRITRARDRNIIALSDGSLIINQQETEKVQDSGIKDRIDSLLVLKDSPLQLLIGCTPPNLYRFIEDEGEAEPVQAFQKLSVRDDWYTPWGGPPAVRSLAKTVDGWVYADIHVGSIMRSPDNGDTWEPVNPELHRDVHQVITSQTYNERVYANTYRSVYVSDDRGDTWHHRSEELRDRYGRGIAVHPTEPDILLCGVSDGPTGDNVHGQLYRSEDAGRTWIHVVDGFPESTMKNIDTFHIQYEGDKAWVSDGKHLYLSQDKGKKFKLYWTAPEEITMINRG